MRTCPKCRQDSVAVVLMPTLGMYQACCLARHPDGHFATFVVGRPGNTPEIAAQRWDDGQINETAFPPIYDEQSGA